MKNNFKQPIGLTSAEVDQRTKEGKVNRAVNDDMANYQREHFYIFQLNFSSTIHLISNCW